MDISIVYTIDPDELKLCTTDEIYNEINRLPVVVKERNKMRLFADSFLKITCTSDKFDDVYESLKNWLLISKNLPITDINIRQIARTIASGKSTFIVTTDVNLLSYSAFGSNSRDSRSWIAPVLYFCLERALPISNKIA